MIYIFLLFLWLILVGEITDFSIITGIIFMFITLSITNMFFGKKSTGLIKLLVMTIASILAMYKTAFEFIPLIFGKHYSGISKYNAKNLSKIEKVAIANCITLTPKTLFIDEDKEDNSLIIHQVTRTVKDAHTPEDIWEGELF